MFFHRLSAENCQVEMQILATRKDGGNMLSVEALDELSQAHKVCTAPTIFFNNSSLDSLIHELNVFHSYVFSPRCFKKLQLSIPLNSYTTTIICLQFVSDNITAIAYISNGTDSQTIKVTLFNSYPDSVTLDQFQFIIQVFLKMHDNFFRFTNIADVNRTSFGKIVSEETT